jgi:hypothetical protein
VPPFVHFAFLELMFLTGLASGQPETAPARGMLSAIARPAADCPCGVTAPLPATNHVVCVRAIEINLT